MFVNGKAKKYDIELMNGDISVHSGILKYYYSVKDYNFEDWGI